MIPIRRALERVPDLLALHRRDPDDWPVLLASTARGQLGRWDILMFADPGGALTLDADGILSGPGSGNSFLDRLDAWQACESGPADPELPFSGGWFVYLGYELVGEIEPRLNLPRAPDNLPRACALRCRGALIADGDSAWLVAEDPATEVMMHASLARDCEPPAPAAYELSLDADPGEHYMAGVERIREYVRAGDVFQVNLSRGWRARADRPLDPAALFRKLAEANAAPFAGLAHLPGGSVLSSSPERLVQVRGDAVQTRPIAGTRPRGESAEHDDDLRRELIGHPKERAEHIMLIDLERNDLGRVCRPGTVEVSELMVIESYAHVHHIVSNVRGLRRPGATPGQVLAAVFPGGTITGCPKIRCMEIIAELEGAGRSFYTGAMGYMNRNGDLDMNILIRSMRVTDNELAFRTGGGIVVDSEPEAELAETEAKARGMLVAIGHG